MPLLLLEHINLNILDVQVAREFYVGALGAVENPVATNERQLHVNVGLSQFHLLLQYSPAVSAPVPVGASQVWSGTIELATSESLEAIRARVSSLARTWASSGLTAQAILLHENTDAPSLAITGPWGNQFVVHRAADSNALGKGYLGNCMGSHPGGSGALVALTRAVHTVRPGAAAALHSFWSHAFGADAELSKDKDSCSVRFSSGQELSFMEAPDAPAADAYDKDERSGFHIAFYMDSASAFADAFQRCEHRLYRNPNFAGSPPEFGNAVSWEEARSCGQFRIKDLGDDERTHGNNEGRKPAVAALVMELEVRARWH